MYRHKSAGGFGQGLSFFDMITYIDQNLAFLAKMSVNWKTDDGWQTKIFYSALGGILHLFWFNTAKELPDFCFDNFL